MVCTGSESGHEKIHEIILLQQEVGLGLDKFHALEDPEVGWE